MKKLYTLGIALSMIAFGTQSFAQVSKMQETQRPLLHKKTIITSDEMTQKKPSATAKDGIEVYFYEDFSNGFDGMEDNGLWTVGEDNGNLWFQTFPAGQPNGYDPAAPILNGEHPDYQNKLASYYGGDVVNSPTRDNGIMMFDVDRLNYQSTTETEVKPVGTLISPSIDLSDIASNDLTLSFWQKLRQCCADPDITVQLSVDGGSEWFQYDVLIPFGGAVNVQLNREIRIDISDIIGSTTDLSNVKIQFKWAGQGTSYMWQIDDIAIELTPDNNLLAKRTFRNNYVDFQDAFEEDTVGTSASAYYNAFEYREEPNYYARPLNFGMEVANEGLLTQTDVRLKVTGTAPVSGDTHEWISANGVEIERGVMDTVRISNALLTDINGTIEIGQYLFDYTVVQAEAEQTPDDNDGVARQATITNEEDNGGYAMLRNDANVPTTSKYTALGSDAIWSNVYVFPELHEGFGAKYITHVEAVLQFNDDWAETQVGEEIYFNVREGHAFFAGSTALFGTSNYGYNDENLKFTIGEDDIWYYDSPAGPFVWASFELPSPILITPGVVYQAEYRIPFAVGDIVLPAMTARYQEPYGTLVYDHSAEPPSWFHIGRNTVPLRFRTGVGSVGIDKITVESGITLVQNYPNPFTDLTNIQFSLEESSKVNLEVRDLTGKLVFSKDFGNVPANVVQRYELQRGDLASGMYTYTIATSEFQVSRKLTVQ